MDYNNTVRVDSIDAANGGVVALCVVAVQAVVIGVWRASVGCVVCQWRVRDAGVVCMRGMCVVGVRSVAGKCRVACQRAQGQRVREGKDNVGSDGHGGEGDNKPWPASVFRVAATGVPEKRAADRRRAGAWRDVGQGLRSHGRVLAATITMQLLRSICFFVDQEWLSYPMACAPRPNAAVTSRSLA